MKAFLWVVAILALVLMLAASCTDTSQHKAKQVEARARVEAMPVKPPLAVVDMTATVPGAMPLWTNTTVMRDPETGCQYLKTASGDLTPRMEGMPPVGAGYAEYQRGCKR